MKRYIKIEHRKTAIYLYKMNNGYLYVYIENGRYPLKIINDFIKKYKYIEEVICKVSGRRFYVIQPLEFFENGFKVWYNEIN